MSEKLFELLDLLFTFILLGSLIREIPAVKKILVTLENALEFGANSLPNEDHEIIRSFSNFFGFISLFLFILVFILSLSISKFSLQISSSLYISLFPIFIISLYLWMSLKIAKPTKKETMNYLTINWWIITAPFLFLGTDLLLKTPILAMFSQHFFNPFLNIFGYHIPNQLLTNFLAFFIFFYTSILIYLILIWLISRPPYFLAWLVAKIMKHKQKQERFLFFILLAFLINKLVLIFAF